MFSVNRVRTARHRFDVGGYNPEPDGPLPTWCTDVYTGKFLWCSSEMQARAMAAAGHPKLDPRGRPVAKAMHYAGRRFWQIAGRAEQVAFLRLNAPGDAGAMTWHSLGPMVVRDFHTDVVSAFDAVALVFARECGHYCDGRWFPHYSQFTPADRNLKQRAKLDPPVLPLIDRLYQLFTMVNAVRNGLIHRDDQCTIFGGPDQTMYFQVYDHDTHDVLIGPTLLHWQNQIVDFGLYFALVFCELWELFEDVAKWVASRHAFRIPRNIGGTMRIGNYALIVTELERLEAKLVDARGVH